MNRAELLELYKLAHTEYRAEVALGWSRARTFLVLGFIAPVVAMLAPAQLFGDRKLALTVSCLLSVAAAIAGFLLVGLSHTRYRAARTQLEALAGELGVAPMQTTGGMREGQGKPRGELVRAKTVLAVLFTCEALGSLTLLVGSR